MRMKASWAKHIGLERRVQARYLNLISTRGWVWLKSPPTSPTVISAFKAWFWQAKRVCGSVQFGSLWSHARSKSLRFTSVQYGVCWYKKNLRI